MTNAPRPIGYYVHHHGAGHRARGVAIAAAAKGRIMLLGTGLAGRTDGIAAIDLADDRLDDGFAGADGRADRPACLHYVPVDHPGIRDRVARVTGWIMDAAPALMVVDVSTEIAMLARLASVPTVVVRLGGDRSDPPHRAAFEGATALLCPFAAALDLPPPSADVAAKSRYCPGLVARPPVMAIDPRRIAVVIGAGGGSSDPTTWVAAARAVPDMAWDVFGPCAVPATLPSNLTIHGWVADVASRIAAAAVVIGGAGDGVVATVVAAARPFVCIPGDRPFGEQRAKATALAAAGAAIVCDDPSGADWRTLIDAARRLDPAALAALDDPRGAERAAAWLIALADRDTD